MMNWLVFWKLWDTTGELLARTKEALATVYLLLVVGVS